MFLKDKVALITGAAGGIGAAIARLFASEGADLVLWDLAPVESLKAELTAATGRKVIGAAVDITDPDGVEQAGREAEAELGRIDILVNNAGITRDNIIFRMKPEEWELVLKVNLFGPFNCTKIVGKMMAKKRAGSIINISSVIGLRGNAGQANYGASKAGLIGLTKSSARELARFGVRVNALAPGYIQTAMTDKLTPEQKSEIQKQIPLAALGTSEDVAKAALFLSSALSGYITGEVIRVDGGFAM
ncbi:MAG: 3-oxoacyl-[acyl-carrier-protein] reductase [Candidatus Omnitrophica bacterium]|nr:3-oxoacyl-[acyl-carrier-protein] reductase [Candidatus Omnitrophota bacterium]